MIGSMSTRTEQQKWREAIASISTVTTVSNAAEKKDGSPVSWDDYKKIPGTITISLLDSISMLLRLCGSCLLGLPSPIVQSRT